MTRQDDDGFFILTLLASGKAKRASAARVMRTKSEEGPGEAKRSSSYGSDGISRSSRNLSWSELTISMLMKVASRHSL